MSSICATRRASSAASGEQQLREQLVALRHVAVRAHPDADDLVLAALLRQQRGGDGRVDAAAHGGHDPAHAVAATFGCTPLHTAKPGQDAANGDQCGVDVAPRSSPGRS